jgi:hypothetical protein
MLAVVRSQHSRLEMTTYTLPSPEKKLMSLVLSRGNNIFDIVTCIARQMTGKHLATEYAQATIELRKLLLVARQQSTPMKSLTRNYVTGFLWVRAVTTLVQRLDKQTLNNGATVFRGVRAEGLS